MQFNTTVKSAYFREESRSWLIADVNGNTYTARFLITATGVLGRPTLPKLQGLSDFEGIAFHTAHWPTNLGLSGKRVGIIGTGASGIQVVQSIAKTDIASLTVFQRTANWSAPLRNSPIDEQEMVSIRERYDKIFEKCDRTHFSFIHSGDQRKTFDVPECDRLDFWEELYAKPGFAKWLGNFEDVNSDAAANAAYSNFVADKIRQRVKHPDTAEKLIPKDHGKQKYSPCDGRQSLIRAAAGFGTKRVPLETNYFEAYNEPHVRLVDVVNEAPIECVTSTGVQLATGEHVSLDVLIYATGYEAVTGPLAHIDFQGSNDTKLSDVWQKGPKTYLGIFVPHFPNLMMVMGPHQM
jgi:cation diffusion facilitator CzcD-associated flavoprotein CzcO